jgi:hypothetical protein
LFSSSAVSKSQQLPQARRVSPPLSAHNARARVKNPPDKKRERQTYGVRI